MAPSYHSPSGRDPGEGALVAGLLDPLQLGLHADALSTMMIVMVTFIASLIAGQHNFSRSRLIKQSAPPRMRRQVEFARRKRYDAAAYN